MSMSTLRKIATAATVMLLCAMVFAQQWQMFTLFVVFFLWGAFCLVLIFNFGINLYAEKQCPHIRTGAGFISTVRGIKENFPELLDEIDIEGKNLDGCLCQIKDLEKILESRGYKCQTLPTNYYSLKFPEKR